eukprot:s3272_g3.t1
MPRGSADLVTLAGQPDAAGYANGAKRPAASVKKKAAAATPATPEGQLLKAARSGSLMSVMRLLQMGVDPNASPLALVQQWAAFLKEISGGVCVGLAWCLQTPTRNRSWCIQSLESKIHLIPRYPYSLYC